MIRVLEREDAEVAKLISSFLERVDPESIDEVYVSVFEAPAKCSLYAHEYLLKNRQEELGRFLLELKGIYRLYGVDVPVRREIPDYLPLMLEFLSLLYDVNRGEAERFARRYLSKWIGELRSCLERNNSIYSILARALETLIERI